MAFVLVWRNWDGQIQRIQQKRSAWGKYRVGIVDLPDLHNYVGVVTSAGIAFDYAQTPAEHLVLMAILDELRQRKAKLRRKPRRPTRCP